MVSSDFNVRFMRYGFLKSVFILNFMILIKTGKGLIPYFIEQLIQYFVLLNDCDEEQKKESLCRG